MLEIKNLTVCYGAISALQGISLSVPSGSIVTLIGSNGAGKTTTLKTISGLLKPKAGEAPATVLTLVQPAVVETRHAA